MATWYDKVDCGFFNAKPNQEGDPDRVYDAKQMGEMFTGVILDGVFSSIGDKMIVTQNNGGMSVLWGTGKAWFNNTWSINKTPIAITIDPADPLYERIDVIGLFVWSDDEFRQNYIYYIPGTPSNSPQKPVNPSNPEMGRYFYPLAYVTVPAGAVGITNANIENVVGTSECPFVTGPLEHVTADELNAKWWAEYNALYQEMRDTIDGLKQTEIVIPPGTVSSTYTAWVNSADTEGDNGDTGWWINRGNDIWVQKVRIQGMLETDNPIIDVTYDAYSEEDLTEERIEGVKESWGKVYMINSTPGYLMMYAHGKPEWSFRIRALCIRR